MTLHPNKPLSLAHIIVSCIAHTRYLTFCLVLGTICLNLVSDHCALYSEMRGDKWEIVFMRLVFARDIRSRLWRIYLESLLELFRGWSEGRVLGVGPLSKFVKLWKSIPRPSTIFLYMMVFRLWRHGGDRAPQFNNDDARSYDPKHERASSCRFLPAGGCL